MSTKRTWPRHTWYVSFNQSKGPNRYPIRETRTFPSEADAKKFAGELLNSPPASLTTMLAGTINPYYPRRVIGSSDIVLWIRGRN
ncbi:hypothetical protein CK489_16615 [Bradyrhizobium sp. UFLA03-84]|nr:hypothetical protein CK489_16615 [Bradyrhizobium sp. UFLA03-84]